MTDSRRFRLLDLIPFLLVLATAAGARVGYLVTRAEGGDSAGPLIVQDASPELVLTGGQRSSELDALRGNIRDHHWFGSLAPFANQEERTAHVAPGYPWLLGELERYAPADLGPTDRLVRWLQALLGTLTAGLYYLLARRAFPGRVVAVLAGLLCALHPFWIVSTAAVNDGVLVTFLLAVCLWLGVRASQIEGGLTSLLYGVALAGLALTRAALVPFAIVALLWLLRHGRRVQSGWQVGFLAIVGFLLALAPWAQRNFQAFTDVYPVVNSTYYHLWVGNNAKANGGPLTEEIQQAAWNDARKLNEGLPDLDALAELPQAERYRRFAHAALAEVMAEPDQTIRRRLWSGLYFFFGKDWFTDQRLARSVTLPGTDIAAADPVMDTYLLASLLLMMLLGVLGWRWTFAWRREARPLALATMWIPLPYILGSAEALAGPRLPLDGVLLVYAAFVLACIAPNGVTTLLRGRPKYED